MMFSPMNMILLAAADAPAVAAPAMPNAEAALSFFSGWTWMHWLALALCVLVLLFVLYLICNMIVRRIRLRRMVNTMREDLLLRRELADMAGGKDIKAQRQEQYLRTESIRMDVQTSVARMRENGVDPQHTGCWLLLGEPGAGKSRLMQFGGIEFPAGINDMTDEGEATSTFKLWLCAKGAVWDIGGRMLLNRWGGKQDNEWRVFLEEFRKAYGNGLPNGVVLTIPADALLQDDSALRARKISMLAEELRTLVRVTGACCPVWVVVTKCDLVPGFSDFFSLMNDEDLRRSLGWRNGDRSGTYHTDAVQADFKELTEKLRRMRDAYAANAHVWESAASGAERADTMAPVYLMPERFADMQDSLQRYLDGIFTDVQHHEKHGDIHFRFCGCWFTAALDRPVSNTEHILIENRDGKLQPVVVPGVTGADPAAMWHDAGNSTGLVTVREHILSTASERRYFTADLLNKVICGCAGGSRYTHSAVRRIRRPYRRALVLLTGISLPLAGWAALSHPDLHALAQRDMAFWTEAERLFKEGHIAESPLLAADKEKQVALTGRTIPTTNMTRRDGLSSLSNMTLQPAAVPFFWRPAAWMVDQEFDADLLADSKHFVDKAALVNMLLKPAVDSARETLTYRADHADELKTAWHRSDTSALVALMQITRYGIDLMEHHHRVTDDIPYMDLVSLNGAPVQDAAIKSLWLHGVSTNRDMTAMSPLNGYLRPVSPEAALALSKAVALYASETEQLKVYPGLHYEEMHRFTEALARMLETKKQMNELEEKLTVVATGKDEEINSIIDRWKELYQELVREKAEVQERAAVLGLMQVPSLRAEVDNINSALSSQLLADQNRFSKLLVGMPHCDNADFLTKQGDILRNAIGSALPRLTGEYANLTDELCAFWDFPQDKQDNRRPWERFCDYADALNALLNMEFPTGDKSERIGVRIRRLEEYCKKQDQAFETLKAWNPELDEACKDLLRNRMVGKVVLVWLNEAPHSNAELMATLPEIKQPRTLPRPPFGRDGKLTVRSCYDTENAQRALQDCQELVSYAENFLPKATPDIAADLEDGKNSLRDAAEHYLADYLLYWMDEVPSYYKRNNIRTWAQFVQSGEAFNASHTPDSIFTINRLMLDALSIPALADDQLYPELAQKRQALKDAQEALTPDVRRRMDNTAEFFSTLDVAPGRAWQTLQNMDTEDYFASWWGAWYADKTGDCVLIWNDFLTKGMTLLKQETSAALMAASRDCLGPISMFPLNSTPNRSAGNILSVYDLEVVQEKLAGTNPEQDSKQRDAEAKKAASLGVPEELAALKLPLKHKREHIWQQVGKVLQLLATPEQPLNCIPVLPAADKRNAAFTGEGSARRIIPVSRRYPYMRILCGGRALTPRISLNRVNDADMDLCASALAADTSDLEFEFYRHSGSTAADASVKFPGGWSPLNLYLRQGSRLGDDKKTAYVPVVFRDKEGYTCLFWAGLRFNREMIAADEWPGSAVFDTAQDDPDADRKQKEKQLRKAVCATFIGPHFTGATPGVEERTKLQAQIDELQKDGCSISFEIVTPGSVAGEDETMTRSAGRFPYFSMGTDLESSGKLRAMPESTKTADYRAPGGEPALLRLFRHAEDEYSTLYVRTEESLLHYVIRHATAYESTEGYFTVPFTASGNGESAPYTLHLRPVLSPTYDDGLLPSDDFLPEDEVSTQTEILTD